MPLVAVLASFQVLIASVTRPARLALLPHISGHIVVLGSSSMTEAALTTLAARGRQIVVANPQITGGRRAILEGLGLTVLEADPRQRAVIRSLHLSRAAAVFFLAEDDVANLNAAMLALPAIDERPKDLAPLLLAVKVDREELAVELPIRPSTASRADTGFVTTGSAPPGKDYGSSSPFCSCIAQARACGAIPRPDRRSRGRLAADRHADHRDRAGSPREASAAHLCGQPGRSRRNQSVA